MKQPHSNDEQGGSELAGFGYPQQLRRSLGTFSSFALAFSLISINTGIFAISPRLSAGRAGHCVVHW